MPEVQETTQIAEPIRGRVLSDAEWETIGANSQQASNEETLRQEVENKVQESAQPKEEVKVPETEVKTEVKTESKVEEKPIEQKQEVAQKEFDPFEVLGFGEEKDKSFISKIHEAYKEGKLEEFLEKSTKNYDKLSNDQILRIKIQKENPDLESEDIDFLMAEELARYGAINEEGEIDEKGTKRMALELRKVREELKKEQESYKASAYERKPSAEQLKAEEQAKQFVESINNDTYFAELGRSKALEFGDFKVEVPEGLDIKGAAIDPTPLFSKFINNDGSLNSQKFAKWAALAQDPDKTIADAIAYGKSLGTKEHHDELRGVSKDADTMPANDKAKPRMRILN